METIDTLISKYTSLSLGAVNFEFHTMQVSTFHSTSLEGSTLTINEVHNLLDHGQTAKNKPYTHHLMTSDFYNALKYVVEFAKEKNQLTVQHIQYIASLVMKNTGSEINTALGSYDISKGEIRKSGVSAGQRLFPNHTKVEQLLSEMVVALNNALLTTKTNQEKIAIAFKLQFDFVSIHPFGDGNGRTARLLTDYVLAYFELPLCIVFKQDRLKYIAALEKSREKENLLYFTSFMENQYRKYLSYQVKLLEK